MGTKEWLASLKPIKYAAAEYTWKNVDECERLAEKFDSLVVVGIDKDLYVDRNRFEQFMNAKIADTEEAKIIAPPKLRRGGKKAAKIQEALQKLEVSKYRNMSFIKALERDELKSDSEFDRKNISKRREKCEDDLAKMGEKIRAKQRELDDLVEKYG